MLKFSGAVIWRLGSRGSIRKYATPSATMIEPSKIEGNTISENAASAEDDKYKSGNSKGLITAAFSSIYSPDPPEGGKKPSPKSIKLNTSQQLDSQINKASDVQSLLVVAENSFISRKHALKIVSVLSEWSSSNKVQVSDFERDPRFLKLCRILARTPTTEAMSSMSMVADISTVLGITGDDEAARLIANLSLAQIIKVMKALTDKGRRSTPLLRALSHNIVRQPEPIDLKCSADLLYSMTLLNFPDPVLLDRICGDVITQLPNNKDKSAVVNSILVSLGLLKYRHGPCLAALADWLAAHRDVCRPSDLASAVLSFASLNCDAPAVAAQTEAALAIKEEDLTKPAAWLDLVFALLMLGRASERHLVSTLQPEFMENLLASGEISIPARRKLMAIDAYLSLAHPEYSGPRLPEYVSLGVPVVYTKEKSLYVQSVIDTFRNLVSSENFLKKECNSNMGFLYDGELALDAKCNPVPLKKAMSDKKVFRIAILSLDYHDMTRKTPVPLGPFQLYSRLLQLKGFKVLQIPYTEFNPQDKLVARVQYIEKRLKQLVSEAAY